MELYLTSGIEVTDRCFESLENFKRVNIRDLVLSERSSKPNSRLGKFEIVENWLHKVSNQNVLIGNMLNSIDDYQCIKLKFSKTDFNIKRVYIRFKNTHVGYSKNHSNFSNWLDYSPEFVRRKDEDSNLELLELANILDKDGISVKIVD